jgi:hypothetical protein
VVVFCEIRWSLFVGVIFALHQSSGIQLVSRDFWYTSWSRGAISLLSSFRSLGERLSDPGALCACRPFRSFSMPFDVNLKSGIIE